MLRIQNLCSAITHVITLKVFFYKFKIILMLYLNLRLCFLVVFTFHLNFKMFTREAIRIFWKVGWGAVQFCIEFAQIIIFLHFENLNFLQLLQFSVEQKLNALKFVQLSMCYIYFYILLFFFLKNYFCLICGHIAFNFNRVWARFQSTYFRFVMN